MSEDFEFVSRYDVLGPPSRCLGACEGTGFIPHAVYLRPPVPNEARPVSDADEPPIYRVLWFLLEARNPLLGSRFEHDDPWHFIPCPDCRADDPLVRLAWKLMGNEA